MTVRGDRCGLRRRTRTAASSLAGIAREELGAPELTTHSFRKMLATLIDDEGLTAWIGAGLGHRPRSTRLTNQSRGDVALSMARRCPTLHRYG